MKHTSAHAQDDGVQVEKEKLPTKEIFKKKKEQKHSLGLFWNVQLWSRVRRACNSKIDKKIRVASPPIRRKEC